MSWTLYLYTACGIFVAVAVGYVSVGELIHAHATGSLPVMGTLDLTIALTMLFVILYQNIRAAVAEGIKDARPEP